LANDRCLADTVAAKCHADALQGPAQTQGLGLRDRQAINDAQGAYRRGSKVGSAEIAQDARMASITARQGEVLEQAGYALVENRPIVATGFVAKC
jgi:hypothetical protein